MITSNWQEVESDGSTMRMYMSVPQGSGPFPAVVAIQHQGGVDEFMENMTKRLAAAGYLAVAPDLYHRDGPDCKDDIVTRRTRLRDRTIINDVNAAVSFLQRHNSVEGQRLGIIGFCMGGRVVYLMAAANPNFKAAVAYYAGNTFRAWGRDTLRHLSAQPRFTARCSAISARTTKIRLPKICRNWTPNSPSSASRMSSILIPMPPMPSWIAPKKATVGTPMKRHGRALWIFSSVISEPQQI